MEPDRVQSVGEGGGEAANRRASESDVMQSGGPASTGQPVEPIKWGTSTVQKVPAARK